MAKMTDSQLKNIALSCLSVLGAAEIYRRTLMPHWDAAEFATYFADEKVDSEQWREVREEVKRLQAIIRELARKDV